MVFKERHAEFSETEDRQYKIRFESGIHNLSVLPEYWTIEQRFASGDLTASQWNPEVAERMRQYQPSLVAVDQLGASFERRGISWTMLPGSPYEISGRKEIYVVAGDVLYSNITTNKNSPFSKLLETLDQKALYEYLKSAGIESAATLLASIALLEAAMLTKMNRRGLLLGAGAFLSLSAARLSPFLEAFSTNSNLNNLLQGVSGIAKFRFSDSAWPDGRTAILFAKTQDSMDALNLAHGASASIVMGAPHAFRKNEFSTKESRKKFIQKLAEEMMVNIDALLKISPVIPQDQAHDMLLAYLSMIDIYEVTDPGVSYTDNPQQTIKEAIKHVRHLQSPEVREALLPLGNPDRLFFSGFRFKPEAR